jgi:alcohol dehydrogenase YqhD (iron-dependent ADH family)
MKFEFHTVPTLAATGSEMNMSVVISNEAHYPRRERRPAHQ